MATPWPGQTIPFLSNKSGTTWGPLRIVKEGRDRKFRAFQKPHEFQAAKYLNLNARESQFRVIENNCFRASSFRAPD
jgi:hypothetical protein